MERRRSFRTAIATKVQVRHHGDPTRVLITSDVGPRGLFLRSTRPLGVDEMVEMELHLPGESSPIQVDGRVARTKTGTADGQTGMGIRFTRVNNDDAGRLKRFFAAHHALNGSRVVIVSDEPFEMRDIARAIAREGLQPQVLRWSDPPPAADPPICAFVVVPSARGQAADFAALRRSYGQFRPGLLIILKDESLTDEWLALASVCIHGMPEPDRAAALTLCVAIPPPPASHVAVG